MQDRYVGDVGDYGKYGLLRRLTAPKGESPLKLGVFWCRVPCESHNQDGKHVGYLEDPRRFRGCDSDLFDSLRKLMYDKSGNVKPEARAIANVEASTVLPTDTSYFSEALEYPDGLSPYARVNLRRQWVQNALDATAAADLVFLDPDNGIECMSVGAHSSKGPKYVFWDELAKFADPSRGQSLVVYHHMNRNGSTDSQARLLLGEFQERFPHCSTSAVMFTRGTRRCFFVVANQQHRFVLTPRLSGLLSSPWKEHFVPVSLAN